jgi:hypothetical protein
MAVGASEAETERGQTRSPPFSIDHWGAIGPYLWLHATHVLDATYVKARDNGRIVSLAVIVAVAVNSGGRR